jgi:hypothetical protein
MMIIMMMMLVVMVAVGPVLTGPVLPGSGSESLGAHAAQELGSAEAEHAIAASHQNRRDLGDDAQGEQEAEEWRVGGSHGRRAARPRSEYRTD